MIKQENKRSIFVYAHWQGFRQPILMGVMHSERVRGNEVFSFEYDNAWLKSDFIHFLDPQLQMYSGPQFIHEGHLNFGMFLDSSPDRWGRILMRRREVALARRENRPETKLSETDYVVNRLLNLVVYSMGMIFFTSLSINSLR